jgi:exopolyphosphatase/guanosine-5'-triphosphate,3'-diphosphate pyrophosphatase
VQGVDKRPAELIALLDLGSNAARMSLVKIRPGRGFTILEEERVQTRLAGGRDRRLPGRAVRETLRAIHVFLARVQPRGMARVIAVTTAAVRDADNAERLLAPLRRRYRLDLRVLSGQEEARLGARAVAAAMALDAGVIVDLGGGSLQIATLRGGEALTAVSLPLGAVRTTGRFLRHDPPTPTEVQTLRREVRGLVNGALPPASEGDVLIALGGTVRTLARIHWGGGLSGKKLHAARLSRTAVTAIAGRLASLPLRRRRAVPGLKPERADIIAAGAIVMEELMEIGRYERLVVCAHGVRHGVLLEETFGRVTRA